MFEKYLKIINQSKEKHNKIQTFLLSIGIENCFFDIIGDEIIFKISPLDIFVFESHKTEIQEFVSQYNLILIDYKN